LGAGGRAFKSPRPDQIGAVFKRVVRRRSIAFVSRVTLGLNPKIIPGLTADLALIEYKGVPRHKRAMSAADPGSPAFTMMVWDLDAAVERCKAAGGTVVSTGGTSVKSAGRAGKTLVRDINDFVWELFKVAELWQL
jgi:hypothetical protein